MNQPAPGRIQMDLKFGIFLPQAYRWPQMQEQARYVESLGFDSLWLADHFVSPYSGTLDWFECWTTLAALAAVTDTIRLGTGITHIVYRNPAILARAALTVDHISNGRLDLGFGVGSAAPYNHAKTGTPDRETRERVDRYQEAVLLIDQLLRQRETTFEGDYYWVKEAPMNPPPVQQPRPPFNLAAHGPRTLRFAAQHADAWNSFYTGGDKTPEQSSDLTKERNQMLDEFLLEAGRDPATVGRTFFVGYTSDALLDSWEAFDDFIGRYQQAGITEFVFGYVPGFDDEELAQSWFMNPDQLAGAAARLNLPAA